MDAPNVLNDLAARLRSAGCVFAEDEATLLIGEAATPGELQKMVDERIAGRPLEEILGWVEFCGIRIALDSGVFVPRVSTELLVATAASLARTPSPPRPDVVVVDLGCGSGALGVALAATLEHVDLHAVDLDPAAVGCAGRNIGEGNGQVYEGDLYEPLPPRLEGCTDLIVANVPFVPSKAIAFLPRETRLHEPRIALDGGPDGLDVVRRVAGDAARWLAPGGHLLVEVNADQADEAMRIFALHGLATVSVTDEELEATVVVGTRPIVSGNDPGVVEVHGGAPV